jgi:uncharacterized protein with NAD-binding domain and iron-sulfur cluster
MPDPTTETPSTSQTPPRKRIAILGGGMAGMTAAMALTDPENPARDRYEVTLFQMGWRLGGKGASGRNTAPGMRNRIEEHGLHIWFGCYDNAFALMRKAYEELDRPPDAPLARWRDAFKPHGTSGIETQFRGKWFRWVGNAPLNHSAPGYGGLLPMWTYLRFGALMFYRNFLRRDAPPPSPTGDEYVTFPSGRRRKEAVRHGRAEEWFFKTLGALVRRLRFLSGVLQLVMKALVWFNRQLLKAYWRSHRDAVSRDLIEQERWVLLHLMYAIFAGMVRDRVILDGFKTINGQDFRDWIASHALDDGGVMANSGMMLGIYDGMFAYIDGDNTRPPGAPWPPKAKIEAGECLLACIREGLTYRGSPIWKMQAGMGDTVFGPMYQVLKRRGVRFELFHRVDQVTASEDGRTVDRIDMTRQARVIDRVHELGGYAPLIDVKGLPCWPSRPLYAQLVDGDILEREGIDLESYGASWQGDEPRVLERGRDFDDVVMAISVGGLPYIACDLAKKSRKWRDMLAHMRTTRTLASQFWYRRTAFQLGWTSMAEPVVSGYDTGPLNTWADMTHLIERESWDAGARPGREEYPLNIAYYCGVMADDPPLPVTECGPRAPFPDQEAENRKVEAISRELVTQHLKPLFPEANPEPGVFRWEWLVDQTEIRKEHEERFVVQYFRANVEPTERYVLSVPGSDRHRLDAHDDDEFVNLYLAGDWTNCGLNLGCIEAATMSGLLASNALSAWPARKDIIGLEWW